MHLKPLNTIRSFRRPKVQFSFGICCLLFEQKSKYQFDGVGQVVFLRTKASWGENPSGAERAHRPNLEETFRPGLCAHWPPQGSGTRHVAAASESGMAP